MKPSIAFGQVAPATQVAKMRQVCFSITRSLVIIVNLIICALACLLIYVSFNAFDQDYELDTLGDSNQPRLIHIYVSVIAAGLGLIIALLSLLGLAGALKKSKSILVTYAAIVLILVSILFVLVVISFTLNKSTSNYKDIDKSFVNSTVVVYNYVDSSDIKSRIIDNIQRSFSCCGVNSPSDWTEYSLHKIPKSCCSEPVQSSLPVFKYCAESDHKIGCWRALTDHFHANLAAVRAILYVLIAFGMVCTVAAFFMYKTLKSNFDVV